MCMYICRCKLFVVCLTQMHFNYASQFSGIILFYLFIYKPREEIILKHAKTGGAPYVHRQYTKKASPKATKEKQKPRKAKDDQQINHPTHS